VAVLAAVMKARPNNNAGGHIADGGARQRIVRASSGETWGESPNRASPSGLVFTGNNCPGQAEEK